ncbi:hypothetical protein [Psychrobacter lutiphocae]|uniref:hypothetical protein n=1 Tax=Psychrobacter lutiphocae TaxID=540500 RepID=UPI000375B3BF|nr:hypothetical protein [Psychrobacter lutiphocae]
MPKPANKSSALYVFMTWLASIGLVIIFYHLFEGIIINSVYMKGFLDHSIYTTIFSVITLVVLLINSVVIFIITKFPKIKNGFFITLWHFTCLLTYLFSLIYFHNYYLQTFLTPSVELRESFSDYSYASVFILSISLIIWLITFSQQTLKLKTPTWLMIILAILTIGLFEFFWMFIDVVSSM